MFPWAQNCEQQQLRPTHNKSNMYVFVYVFLHISFFFFHQIFIVAFRFFGFSVKKHIQALKFVVSVWETPPPLDEYESKQLISVCVNQPSLPPPFSYRIS